MTYIPDFLEGDSLYSERLVINNNFTSISGELAQLESGETFVTADSLVTASGNIVEQIPSLAGYATESWASGQFITPATVNTISGNIVAQIPSLTGYATQSWANGQFYTQSQISTISGNIVSQIPSLTGYATQSWANSEFYTQSQVNTISGNITTQLLLPAGSIMAYGGTSVPSGYLACDGSNVSRTTYSSLFSAIGTTWGAGNGSTTFSVPDLRRRSPVGSGGDSTAQLSNTVGSTGGAETVTLTTTEMPAHTHGGNTGGPSTSVFESGSTWGLSTGTGVGVTGHTHTISSQGGGGAHNNYHPAAIVAFIIKT
jgi:microcystin-dependent protein